MDQAQAPQESRRGGTPRAGEFSVLPESGATQPRTQQEGTHNPFIITFTRARRGERILLVNLCCSDLLYPCRSHVSICHTYVHCWVVWCSLHICEFINNATHNRRSKRG